MEKAKVVTSGKRQTIYLPEKYKLNPGKILIQEHELGLLIIDPQKRWKALEQVMGSMDGDMFPNGREQGE